VSRADDEVSAPLVDVDGGLAGRLDGVDEHGRAGVVGDVDGLAHRQPRPVRPRDRTQNEQRRVVERGREIVEVDPAALGLENPNLDTVFALEPTPRQDARGVFEISSDDDVALVPLDRACDAVDSVSRALGERDLRRADAEEIGDGDSRRLVRSSRSGVDVAFGRRLVLMGFERRFDRVDDSAGTGSARAGVEVVAALERRNVRPERLVIHVGPSSRALLRIRLGNRSSGVAGNAALPFAGARCERADRRGCLYSQS
jgi:hypothetical protein